MCTRSLMIACTGSHTTVWHAVRGDEHGLVVIGSLPEGNYLELVHQCADGSTEILPLVPGENPFPRSSRRYSLTKQVTSGAVEVPTTVKLKVR